MTAADLDRVLFCITHQRPVHWLLARVLLLELVRVRAELDSCEQAKGIAGGPREG